MIASTGLSWKTTQICRIKGGVRPAIVLQNDVGNYYAPTITIETKPKELVEQLKKHKAEQEKRSIEDEVRSHLRGFARTIPSFIMAYGDGKLTLTNFDDYTEDDVFYEVTGITEDEFRFLRDGGDYTNPDTGETEHFNGHLFDEVVFDDSIEEFWYKKFDSAFLSNIILISINNVLNSMTCLILTEHNHLNIIKIKSGQEAHDALTIFWGKISV